MTHRRFGLDVLDSVAGLLSQLQNGFAVAAAYLGKSEKILRNKVSRHVDTNHLSVVEFVELNHFLRSNVPFGWDAALQTLCFEFNGVFMPLPAADVALSERDDVQALLSAVKEHGEAVVACSSALQSGRLSEAQYQDVMRECMESMAAVRALMVRIRERHSARK